MLYLIKGSRVREYHRQNVEILSAAEGAPFEVAYSRRWIQTDLRPAENDGAVIVFSDSPYEHFTPIRFAVIEQVDETDGRLTLRGRLGPFVRTVDRSALDQRWSTRGDDERPGRHRFLVEDDNVGLFTPSSPSEAEDAWRSAVDALAANPFFDSTTVVRVTGIELDGRVFEPGAPLSVGDRADVGVELRTPHQIDGELVPSLLTDPEGSLALVGNPQLPPNGTTTLSIDVLEPGHVHVSLALAGRTLTSTQIQLDVEVRDTPDGRYRRTQVAPSGPSVTGVTDVVGIARFLHRNAQIDDAHWLQLLDDQLLPAAPDHPALLAYTAQHAAAVGRDDRVLAVLLQIDDRTPAQQVLLLIAAVRLGRTDLLPELLSSTDLSAGDAFDRFLVAVETAPESSVNIVLNEELRHRYLGDDRRTRLVRSIWPRLTSIDLLCRAAEDIAYLDPDAGAGLLLDRWPHPGSMPDAAAELLLDWGVRRDRLGPYVRERLRRTAERDDLHAMERVIPGIESVARGDQPALLLEAGLHMSRATDVLVASRGVALAVDGFHRALQFGEVDLAAAALPDLLAIAAVMGPSERDTVQGLVASLDLTIADSDELARWERMRSATRADALRPITNGRRLFALGGSPVDWFEELGESLGLAECRWILTDKDKSARHDWADDLSERDIVLAVLPEIGHDSTSVKAKVLRQGAAFQVVRRNRMSVLDGIERAVARPASDS